MSEREGVLLPCPFCGKSDTLIVTDSDQWEKENDIEQTGHDTYHSVFCDGSKPNGRGGCGASSGFKPTEAEAIEHWNRRADLRAETREECSKAVCRFCEQGYPLNGGAHDVGTHYVACDALRIRALPDAKGQTK